MKKRIPKYVDFSLRTKWLIKLYMFFFSKQYWLNNEVRKYIFRFGSSFAGEDPICFTKYGIRFDVNEIGFKHISAKEDRHSIIVTLIVERPGMLIGKHGVKITLLEHFLTEKMKKFVHFNIIESELWFIDYSKGVL